MGGKRTGARRTHDQRQAATHATTHSFNLRRREANGVAFGAAMHVGANGCVRCDIDGAIVRLELQAVGRRRRGVVFARFFRLFLRLFGSGVDACVVERHFSIGKRVAHVLCVQKRVEKVQRVAIYQQHNIKTQYTHNDTQCDKRTGSRQAKLVVVGVAFNAGGTGTRIAIAEQCVVEPHWHRRRVAQQVAHGFQHVFKVVFFRFATNNHV